MRPVQDRQHYPALDGLRGVGVLAVVGFHAWPGVMSAGSYGVTIFFVLSGFLITRVLLWEVDTHGRISFPAFYARRAFRLLPALFIVLAAYLILGGSWANIVAPLFYFQNYEVIAGGSPTLLRHTWSLAVEEHFYLIWPFVIAAVPHKRRLKVVAIAFAASALWRALVLIFGSADWAYYGTDTNAVALLGGCFIAVAPEMRPSRLKWSPQAVALVGLCVLPIVTHQTGPYMWVYYLVVALAMIVMHQSTDRVTWLEWGWLKWFGQISYGLYLWHFLVLRLEILHPALAVVLSVLLAGAMWRWVESPILASSWANSTRKAPHPQTIR